MTEAISITSESHARVDTLHLDSFVPQVKFLASEEITDCMIAAAALLAYVTIKGSGKTITTTDVINEFGIVRGSRAWERRSEILSHQRISYILKKTGFKRATASKVSRFTLAEEVKL